MDQETVRTLSQECETMVAEVSKLKTRLGTSASRVSAEQVITWVRLRPNSTFHSLIDWTDKADPAATATYRRGQMIALLDQITVHADKLSR